MQTFKDTDTGEIYQYEDDVIIDITNGVSTVSVYPSGKQVFMLTAPATLQPYTIPALTAAQVASAAKLRLQSDARTVLDVTDLVAFRCFKAGVPYPAEWQSYTLALRSIVNGTDTTSTSLPSKPAYPAGT
jgi:hypothetical protein